MTQKAHFHVFIMNNKVVLYCIVSASQPSDTHPGAHIDFARKRLQLGESLYFKTLESIVMGEKKRLSASGRDPKEKVDLTVGG